MLPVLRGGLQRDGVHDEGDELGHVGVHVVLVQLVHEHHDDGQLGQHLQALHSFRDNVVLKAGNRAFARHLGNANV